MFVISESDRIRDCEETLRLSADIAATVAAYAEKTEVGVVEACGYYLNVAAATCSFIINEVKGEEDGDPEDDGAAGR